MNRLFIFGIGGTGSRVIRAFQMLLAANAGGISADTEVFPIIIDYDVKNGDKKRTMDALELYSKINKGIYNRSVYDVDHPDNGFFSTKMMQMKEALKDGKSTFNLQYSPSSDSKKYGDSIALDSMLGELKPTRNLLEMLYNTDVNQEYAELYIDTTVGFRGNPNIGSVMLDQLETTDEFKEFQRLCNSDTDRVVIIGSLFGGTGSSGIPVLVNAIRNNTRTQVKNVKISTVLVCPYFKVSAPKSGEEAKGVIDDKIFESKTKAALHYYSQSLNNKIDAIYYVGDTCKSDVDHNIGEEKQKNPANIVELVSALAVSHFYKTSFAIMNRGVEWKYGLNDKAPVPVNGGDADDAKSATELDFSMFANENYSDVKKLVAYVLANRIINEYILINNEDSHDHTYFQLPGFHIDPSHYNSAQKKFQSILKDFTKFFGYFKKWAEELEEGTGHRLVGFDFKSEEICDMVKIHEFRKTEKNFLRKEVKKSTLIPKDVFAEWAANFNEDHMVVGDSNKLIPGETLEYAFFYSLYKACEKLVNEKFVLK